MLNIINFIKVYFLQITCIVIAICLAGVWINSCHESKNEKEYNVTYTLYSVDTTQATIITKGFPQLNKHKDKWRLNDNTGEIFNSKDSITIDKVELR